MSMAAVRRELKGARFLHPEEDVKTEFPRDPSEYSLSPKFKQRCKELGGALPENCALKAIQEGQLMKASEGCSAFVLYYEGVTFSLVVKDDDYNGLQVVTIWPYVYSSDEAKASGRWSTKQLQKLQSIAEENKSQ